MALEPPKKQLHCPPSSVEIRDGLGRSLQVGRHEVKDFLSLSIPINDVSQSSDLHFFPVQMKLQGTGLVPSLVKNIVRGRILPQDLALQLRVSRADLEP